MTYVISDVHGNYDLYLEFLRNISFCENDTLYILGDLIDREDEGIQLLQDVMKRNNVIAIKGNHEKMMLPTLEEIANSSKNEIEQIIRKSLMIESVGQEMTLREFAKLKKSEQYDIINFINEMPLYEEITVAGQAYVLVHAGLPYFYSTPIEYYEEEDLLFGPHDFAINHYEDTKVIVGHIPTRFITNNSNDEILFINDTIAIDCGIGFDGQMGGLCLDTMEEFYVK